MVVSQFQIRTAPESHYLKSGKFCTWSSLPIFLGSHWSCSPILIYKVIALSIAIPLSDMFYLNITVEYKCESLNINMSNPKYKCESLNIKMSTVKHKYESLNINENLQSFKKYLRQTLVFMWNSARREKFHFYFSGDFG